GEVVAIDLPADAGNERQARAEQQHLVLGGDRTAETRPVGLRSARIVAVVECEALVAEREQQAGDLVRAECAARDGLRAGGGALPVGVGRDERAVPERRLELLALVDDVRAAVDVERQAGRLAEMRVEMAELAERVEVRVARLDAAGARHALVPDE